MAVSDAVVAGVTVGLLQIVGGLVGAWLFLRIVRRQSDAQLGALGRLADAVDGLSDDVAGQARLSRVQLEKNLQDLAFQLNPETSRVPCIRCHGSRIEPSSNPLRKAGPIACIYCLGVGTMEAGKARVLEAKDFFIDKRMEAEKREAEKAAAVQAAVPPVPAPPAPPAPSPQSEPAPNLGFATLQGPDVVPAPPPGGSDVEKWGDPSDPRSLVEQVVEQSFKQAKASKDNP